MTLMSPIAVARDIDIGIALKTRRHYRIILARAMIPAPDCLPSYFHRSLDLVQVKTTPVEIRTQKVKQQMGDMDLLINLVL